MMTSELVMKQTAITPLVNEEQPRGRKEDFRLLTGRGKFVDDFNFENQAYMGLVLSPHAHAKIIRIDFSKILSSPDYIASLTGEDLIKEGVLPVTQNPWPHMRPAKWYHLAVGKVRFAGEPVAAILAKDRESLEDLIDQVEVEYDELPVVRTIEDSRDKKALLYDDWPDNLIQSIEENTGDAGSAISSAAYIVNIREGIARQAAVPIETHAVLVKYVRESESYEVISTQQSVHGLQDILSRELKIPKEKLHVKVMDMGGGFGSKGAGSYPWPGLACLFSKKTGLPVKCTVTRTEEFLNATAGRDEYCDVTLACDSRGKIVALKARVECDAGVSATQLHMPSLTLWTMQGPYNIPNQDLEASVYVTNKMPIGPVRGAGAPEGCYFIERAVEVLAKKIGLDPVEFRRRNISPNGDGNDVALLDDVSKSPHYQELLRKRSEMRSKFRNESASQEKLVLGIGVSLRGTESDEDEGEEDSSSSSSSWEGASDSVGSSWQQQQSNQVSSSSAPSSSGGTSAWPSGGGGGAWRAPELSFTSEYARVVIDKQGRVTVFTGSSSHGQGHETAFAQLASQQLGVPLERITVVWGDTALVPKGIGTFGSRSAVTGGSAVVEASRKLKSKLLQEASQVLGSSVESLEMRNGEVFSKKQQTRLLSLDSLLAKQNLDQISAESVYDVKSLAYSSGVHLCALILDPESGMTKITSYLVVEDCGRIINWAIVDGQLQGGVIHGVGGALLEKLEYDSDGNLLTTSLIDYDIPTAVDSPDLDIFHEATPSKVTLNGAKGVGESGTIGSYAAIMNALNDAISQVRASDVQVNVAPATLNSIYSALSLSM